MFQAESASIPIRPAIALAVQYLPEIHSAKYGTYFPELRTGDTSKATIVADIASAQHEDIRRVIAFDLDAGTSWDASKEIAQAVLDAVLGERYGVPDWCKEFLHEHLGWHHVMACEYEAAA